LNDDPFFANLSAEIMDFLAPTGYHLCMEMVSEETQASTYDELLRTRRVDGLILVESEAQDERMARLLQDRFPFVVIGNPCYAEHVNSDRVPFSVDNDNTLASKEATQHLFHSGFRNVGFLAGPKGVTVSEDRIAGYMQATAQYGATPRVWNCDFGFEPARQFAADLLRNGDMPDGLVVLDDFMAMGVVQAGRAMRIRIPEEMGLVSFNNSRLCQMLECGLTSVSLNIRDIVKSACQTLLDVIEENPSVSPRRAIIPTNLVVRGSSNRSLGVGVA
jgi:DNA-binding LacI/PurR family transcriptional regulator